MEISRTKINKLSRQGVGTYLVTPEIKLYVFINKIQNTIGVNIKSTVNGQMLMRANVIDVGRDITISNMKVNRVYKSVRFVA